MGLLIIKYKTNKLYNEQVCKNFLSNNLLKNLLIRQKIQYNKSPELYLSAILPANLSGRPLFDVKYFIEEEEINCNCSFCDLTNSDKVCSHVAALIESYNANNIINIDNNLDEINKVIEYTKNIQLYQQRQAQKQKDIQALNKLIKNIKQQETVKLVNKIHVLPSITIEKNNNDEFDYYLSLKLGTEKLYVVKSIYDLLKLVKTGGYATYGKNVSINHNINNFDDISKKLIKIVNDLLYLYIQNELLSTSASQTIRVSKRTIETIINLYKKMEWI